MSKDQEYITADLYLASAIACLLRIAPTFATRNHLVFFCFPASQEVRTVVDKYSSGNLNVDALSFATNIKTWRYEMHRRVEERKIKNLERYTIKPVSPGGSKVHHEE